MPLKTPSVYVVSTDAFSTLKRFLSKRNETVTFGSDAAAPNMLLLTPVAYIVVILKKKMVCCMPHF